MDNSIFLTYNGITKSVSNTIMYTSKNDIYKYQWFRYQIIKMCENLQINIVDDLTKNIYNNLTLSKKIKNHKSYNKIIRKKDDNLFGFIPCLYKPPVTETQLITKNKINLLNSHEVIWKCKDHTLF